MSEKSRESDSLDSLVGEAMDGIVDEVTQERGASQDEIARQERRERRNGALAATSVPLALILTTLNLSGLGIIFWTSGSPTLSPVEAEVAAMEILSDAVDEMQWYWEENGHYPARPGFLPADPDDDEPYTWEQVASDHYILSVTIDGQTATFDSNDDADEMFREVRDAR